MNTTVAGLQQRVERRVGRKNAGVGDRRDAAERLLGSQLGHEGLHGGEGLGRDLVVADAGMPASNWVWIWSAARL